MEERSSNVEEKVDEETMHATAKLLFSNNLLYENVSALRKVVTRLSMLLESYRAMDTRERRKYRERKCEQKSERRGWTNYTKAQVSSLFGSQTHLLASHHFQAQASGGSGLARQLSLAG